jgi:hypothetical protein
MKKWWMGPLRDDDPAPGSGGGVPGMPPDPPQPDPAISAMQNQIAQLNQTVQRLTQPPPPPAVNQPAPGSKEEVEKVFWKDPLNTSAAIAQRVAMETMSRYQQQNFETMVESAKSLALADPKLKLVYEKFPVDVEAKLANVDPQFRTNATVWKNAIIMVRGEKADELMKHQSSAPKPGQGDGPAPANHRTAPAPPTTSKLTEDEKKWAANLKLSEEQYAKGKERYENQEQRWGDVITFDSMERRRQDALRRQAQRN